MADSMSRRQVVGLGAALAGAAVAAPVLANTAFAGLALIIVARRETGILKRIRGTPLPPATYLAAVLSPTRPST